jgi:hypothetical protein
MAKQNKKQSYQPFLTPERKIQCKEWAAYWLDKIQEAQVSGQPLYITFLDKKWFYIYSRQKRAKILPPGPGETEADSFLPTIRVASCRHAEKVMLLGVIAKPELDHDFTGKVELLRVCHLEPCQRAIYNWHVGVKKNETVKSSWREALAGKNVAEMKTKTLYKLFLRCMNCELKLHSDLCCATEHLKKMKASRLCPRKPALDD